MSRALVAAIAVSVVAATCLIPHRQARGGEAAVIVHDQDVPRCPSCEFQCPKGTINCWACGTHVPGAKTAKELAPVKLVRIVFRKADGTGSARGAEVPPDVKYEEIRGWIAEHPDEFDKAIGRLGQLLNAVRGTALELTVTAHVARLKRAKAEANRPRSPEEREAEAASAYMEVMREIRKSASALKNVKRLERLLRIVEGTPYETRVQRKLEEQESRLRR